MKGIFIFLVVALRKASPEATSRFPNVSLL